MNNNTRRERRGGVLLIVAAIVFFAGEAIAANAWHGPAYSYARNWISDLGVVDHIAFDGTLIDSPAAWALNSAWIVNGLLALAGVSLLRRVRSTRTGVAAFVFTVGYTIGLITIAFFHEAPAWMFPFHLVGALMAIAGGNVAVTLYGIHALQVQRSRPGAVTLVILGTLGFTATVLQQFIPTDLVGVFERFAAYPVLTAQLVIGIAIAARAGHDGIFGQAAPEIPATTG